MDEQRPWVVLFPHLPLTQTLRLGDRWEVWPLADFDGPWATDWFEDVVRRIAAKHVTSGGTSVRNPALLVDAQSGITGEAPDEDDRSAIEAALGFGVVDAGSFWRPRAELELIAEYEAHLGGKPVADVLEELVERNENRQYAGWSVGTSDNAEPYIWPLNDDASIAMQYGAIVRTTVGGSVRVMAPYELNLPLSLSLDEDRVSALYQVLSEAPIDRGARQLREALRWMLQPGYTDQ